MEALYPMGDPNSLISPDCSYSENTDQVKPTVPTKSPKVNKSKSFLWNRTNIKNKNSGTSDSQDNPSAHESSFILLLKNVKKIKNIGSSSVGMKDKSNKNRSKSLGRSKSFKHEHKIPNGDLFEGKQICFDGDKIPGIVGIKNHGNTCYMNAVLQCLSNTELLTKYFITDQYKQDIRGKSKQNAKKYGTKGELTSHLARLLKSLWAQQYSPAISSDLKSIVVKYGAQYRGTLQHDAQEFLLWFLDKIHEDLNVAAKKKYKQKSGSLGSRSDEVEAAEALASHVRSNNSYVHDLFQALYKSSLTCPSCQQHSNTFDPFLCVSLPLPQHNTKPLFVTVVYLDAHPKQVRLGLLLDPSDSVQQLREALSCDTSIPPQQLILTEIYYDGFHRTFHDSQPLGELREADNIYAIEVPAPDVSKKKDEEESNGHVTLVILNKSMGPQARRFGGPLVVRVARDCSQQELQKQVLESMAAMLQDGALEERESNSPPQSASDQTQSSPLSQVTLQMSVVEELTDRASKCVLPRDVEMPLYMPQIDRALQSCTPDWGPEHVKLIVLWDDQSKTRFVAQSTEQVEEHWSVKQVKQQKHEPVSVSLTQCLTAYTQEERLECGTAWYCPNCKSQQHGTTKAISLWSLPDIFIVHLKRFKQTSIQRSKLETLIKFPLTGLDMWPHVTHHHLTSQDGAPPTSWSPWRPTRVPPTTKEDYVYDLYGVVNHYGTMHGGHYTAFCKNLATNKWYTYDDTKVTEMSEDHVVSSAAYLLFYERRTASSGSVYRKDHWLHKVARLRFTDPPRHSQSHDTLLDAPNDMDLLRNSNPYATMRVGSRHLAASASTGSLGHVASMEAGRQVRADSGSSNQNSPPHSHRHAPFSQAASPHLPSGPVVDLFLDQKLLKATNRSSNNAQNNRPDGISDNIETREVKTGILVDLGTSENVISPKKTPRARRRNGSGQNHANNTGYKMPENAVIPYMSNGLGAFHPGLAEVARFEPRTRHDSQLSQASSNWSRHNDETSSNHVFSPRMIRGGERIQNGVDDGGGSVSYTHIYIEDGAHGVVTTRQVANAVAAPLNRQVANRFANTSSSISGSISAGSGSSYDNLSTDNHVVDRHVTTKSRVKRPQAHVSTMPREIKTRDERNRRGETPEKESSSQPVYLQESCV